MISREVGPLGHRGMADQRAIWVDHPQIGRMDVTYLAMQLSVPVSD
jgi:hypothetical protein